jgi:phosphonatase-like hydrolase
MIQLVVFDMAGTTIDEDNVVYKCLYKSILPYLDDLTLDDVLLHGAGKEKRTAIIDITTQFGLTLMNEDIDQIFDHFKSLLTEAYDTFPLKLYPDTLSLFQWMRSSGIKVALNTGYDRQTAEKILAKVDIQIGRDIDTLVTASDVSRNRPYSDMIDKCCEILSIPPQNTVKVGDSAIDIEEGKAANTLLSIGVTTGAQTEAQISVASPNFVIGSLLELKNIITYHNGMGLS